MSEFELFEPIVNGAGCVVLFLLADVLLDPVQIFCPETDHAVAGLPVEDLVARFLIDFMGGAAFELADPIADEDGRND